MFKQITQITTLKDKKFFIEKINIYYKIVLAYANKNKQELNIHPINIDTLTIKSLIELNIIKDEKDIDLLKKTIKIDLFNNFISSINYSLEHKVELGDLLNKLEPKKRKKAQNSKKNLAKPKLVDFFCGAGGLSLGFIQEGFHVDLANDYEDVCVQTYRYNHPEIPENRVIHGDIRKVVNDIDELVTADIDGVVGGPPCQGFSSANQQRMIDDPRNELYKYFIKAVEKITPKFVVMENVRGMLPYAEQVAEDYKNIESIKNDKKYTYSISYKVLVSDDFGVAQKRHRLILKSVWIV